MCRCEGCRLRMQGDKQSQCYNPEVSGDWTKSDVSHKKTFTLDDSMEKKKAAKERRKTSSEAKAAALLSKHSALRLHPEKAANPIAAQEAAAAVLFEFGTSHSTSTQASLPKTAEQEKDRAFVELYNRLGAKEIVSEFQMGYEVDDENEENDDDDEGEDLL